MTASDLTPGPMLITGVPGFIGSRLLRRLRADHPTVPLYALVEPSARPAAEALRAQILAEGGDRAFEILEGDISKPDCGLDEAQMSRLADVRFVFHAAALYDLAVSRALALAVNVAGTRHMLALAEGLPRLERFNYVSTCYVAGTRRGLVMEHELDEGQHFKNFYEETKFLAEVEVQQWRDRLPLVIYRPAVVVGDSRTGETPKFDGIYMALRALLMGLMMVLPGRGRGYCNIVPVDYVVEAIATLSFVAAAQGCTFQLADPQTLRNREIMELAAERLGVPPPRGSVPMGLYRFLGRSPRVREITGMPAEALAYFDHVVLFDTTATRSFLAPRGITCPPIQDYINPMIDYFRHHVHVPWRIA